MRGWSCSYVERKETNGLCFSTGFIARRDAKDHQCHSHHSLLLALVFSIFLSFFFFLRQKELAPVRSDMDKIIAVSQRLRSARLNLKRRRNESIGPACCHTSRTDK